MASAVPAPQPLKGVAFSTYEQRGIQHPVLRFTGNDPGHAFIIGGNKAKQLLAAVRDNGVDALVTALEDLVAQTDPDWVTGTKKPAAKIASGTGKTKKKAPPPPEPKEEDDGVVIDDTEEDDGKPAYQ